MKQFGKRLAALLLAAATAMGVAASAAAATPAGDYSISVRDKKLTFSRDGKTYSPYEMKSADVRLQIDAEGDLIVSFTDKKGANRGISLGQQRALEVGGVLDSLTLTSSLQGKADVTIDSSAIVDTMTVASRGSVTIDGTVYALNVSGAAKVTAFGTALINLARVTNESARLTAEEGSSVERVTAANKSNIKGPGIGSSSTIVSTTDPDDNDYRVRLKNEDENMVYYVTDRDGLVQLRDVDSDDISLYVQAIGTDPDGDKHYLSGKYTWSEPKKVIFDPDDPQSETYSCKYEFKPSNDDYDSTTGWVKIEVIYK